MLPAQRSAHCFNHFTAQYSHYGTSTYPCETSSQYYRTPTDTPTNGGRGEQCSPAFVRPHGLWELKTRRSPKRAVEGAVPYIFVLIVCLPQNRCRSLRTLPSIRKHKKSGADFLLRHRFVYILTLSFFFYYSAPLSRLAPIEALPQAPQGLCPLTPQALWRRA